MSGVQQLLPSSTAAALRNGGVYSLEVAPLGTHPNSSTNRNHDSNNTPSTSTPSSHHHHTLWFAITTRMLDVEAYQKEMRRLAEAQEEKEEEEEENRIVANNHGGGANAGSGGGGFFDASRDQALRRCLVEPPHVAHRALEHVAWLKQQLSDREPYLLFGELPSSVAASMEDPLRASDQVAAFLTFLVGAKATASDPLLWMLLTAPTETVEQLVAASSVANGGGGGGGDATARNNSVATSNAAIAFEHTQQQQQQQQQQSAGSANPTAAAASGGGGFLSKLFNRDSDGKKQKKKIISRIAPVQTALHIASSWVVGSPYAALAARTRHHNHHHFYTPMNLLHDGDYLLAAAASAAATDGNNNSNSGGSILSILFGGGGSSGDEKEELMVVAASRRVRRLQRFLHVIDQDEYDMDTLKNITRIIDKALAEYTAATAKTVASVARSASSAASSYSFVGNAKSSGTMAENASHTAAANAAAAAVVAPTAQDLFLSCSTTRKFEAERALKAARHRRTASLLQHIQRQLDLPDRETKPGTIPKALIDTGMIDRAFFSCDKLRDVIGESFHFIDALRGHDELFYAWGDALDTLDVCRVASEDLGTAEAACGPAIANLSHSCYWPFTRDAVVADESRPKLSPRSQPSNRLAQYTQQCSVMPQMAARLHGSLVPDALVAAVTLGAMLEAAHRWSVAVAHQHLHRGNGLAPAVAAACAPQCVHHHQLQTASATTTASSSSSSSPSPQQVTALDASPALTRAASRLTTPFAPSSGRSVTAAQRDLIAIIEQDESNNTNVNPNQNNNKKRSGLLDVMPVADALDALDADTSALQDQTDAHVATFESHYRELHDHAVGPALRQQLAELCVAQRLGWQAAEMQAKELLQRLNDDLFLDVAREDLPFAHAPAAPSPYSPHDTTTRSSSSHSHKNVFGDGALTVIGGAGGGRSQLIRDRVIRNSTLEPPTPVNTTNNAKNSVNTAVANSTSSSSKWGSAKQHGNDPFYADDPFHIQNDVDDNDDAAAGGGRARGGGKSVADTFSSWLRRNNNNNNNNNKSNNGSNSAATATTAAIKKEEEEELRDMHVIQQRQFVRENVRGFGFGEAPGGDTGTHGGEATTQRRGKLQQQNDAYYDRHIDMGLIGAINTTSTGHSINSVDAYGRERIMSTAMNLNGPLHSYSHNTDTDEPTAISNAAHARMNVINSPSPSASPPTSSSAFSSATFAPSRSAPSAVVAAMKNKMGASSATPGGASQGGKRRKGISAENDDPFA